MPSVTGQDFVSALPPPPASDVYEVSGRAQQGSTGIAGEEIQLSGETLYSPLITRTTYTGYFIIPNVSPGTYTLSIVSSRFVYNNPTQTVTVVSGMVGGQYVSFTVLSAIVPPPYIVSGTVTSVPVSTALYGGPYTPDVAGVLVTLTGPLYQQVTLTDSNGNFQFSSLPPGTYTLFFSKQQHVLTPSSQVVVVSDTNVSNVASVLTLNPNVNGTIRNQQGTGMGAGITVNFTGPRTATVTTALSSIYQLNNAPIGVWTITPQLAGYEFDPPFRTVTSSISVGAQDFTAIPI